MPRLIPTVTLTAFLAVATGFALAAHHDHAAHDHAPHQCDFCFKLTVGAAAIEGAPPEVLPYADALCAVSPPPIHRPILGLHHDPVCPRGPPVL